MRRFLTITILLLCLGQLTSCLPAPSSRQWGQADLRWLGAADASAPAVDLLAVYTHTNPLTVDIRLDLLDINPGDPYHISLSLWDNRSFSKQPFQVEISSDGSVHTSSRAKNRPEIWPRVLQDFDLDTVSLSLNRFLLGSHFYFSVNTYLPGASTPVDAALNIRSDGLPPTQRASFFLAFWNTFPVSTPAQALRRWDGAHTGPTGGRDGLRYVVEASKRYKIPLALLDLKKPASLAALNYLAVIGNIRYLAEDGLLLLPDVAYSSTADISLAFSRQASAGFNFPSTSFVYDPLGNLHSGYSTQFVTLPVSSRLAVSSGTRLIPLPSTNALEATENGPSLAVRRALVNAMRSPDPADLVVLGGSLPDSTWGLADRTAPTFRWLALHPWIKPLSAADLLAFPVSSRVTLSSTASSQVSSMERELRSAPQNDASLLAWQAYLMLNEPTNNADLRTLRLNYVGQVRRLLAVAHWAEDPHPIADCQQQPLEVGGVECVLADKAIYAALDSNGARLIILFYKDTSGVHQLVGPTSQFAVGLSDPSEWDPRKGKAADPSVISGAFVDIQAPWLPYTPTVTETGLTFTSSDDSRSKAFRLTANGIEVQYRISASETTRIPLAVDPLKYYFGPVVYRPTLGSHTWTWGLTDGINVEVRTDAQISAQGFVSSFPFLLMPEDPDLDYPSGHYLPFPLSLAVIQGEGDFKVNLVVK